MPVMIPADRMLFRSSPWRMFTGRVVFPWVVAGVEFTGRVLELGSGSGAMAEQLLERNPDAVLTATDVDPSMRAAAAERLSRFGKRVEVLNADAAKLPFSDATFNVVLSFGMLHHVIDWETALAEVARVLRPGGIFVGYDVMLSGPIRVLHHLERSPHRLATANALRLRFAELPFDNVTVQEGIAGTVARFHLTRTRQPFQLSDDTPARV